MYIILVYDISLENKGQKVWRDTFKICKKYLHHIQNSVFEGEISKTQLHILQNELNKVIRDQVDSVIIFKGRQKKWLEKIMIGKQQDMTSNFL